LGRHNEWDDGVDFARERLMDRSQIQDWLALGFEIGAHTITHPRLTSIPLPQAQYEVEGSKKRLEDLFGIPIKHFAYPYGAYNSAVVELVAHAGYDTACTCDPGIVSRRSHPFRLERFFTDEQCLRSFRTYNLSRFTSDMQILCRRFVR
jgi:peptidoglycan/xylan/chitin deacetylase (PgdA/CDA1 family)